MLHISPPTVKRPKANDSPDPELTILIPAMNEELSIGQFIEWCKEGVKKAGCSAEIIIVDSSTDKTAEIAFNAGAVVVAPSKKGLGQAYIEAIPYIRGKYVLMGDADCTYDFRELQLFVEKFRDGYQFIMGSRFKGFIQDGAMPRLHRYFGTPLTTAILNVLFGSKFTDIHCGMRGITKAALIDMQLKSQSWEYASEMVLKSVHMELKTTEVPIKFYKDPPGRFSHMKRAGLLEPWRAGFKNLKAMLTYGSDFFLINPGILLLLLGLCLVLPLGFGPFSIGPLSFSLNWMLLGVTLTNVGLGFLYTGLLARLLFDYKFFYTQRLHKYLPFGKTSIGILVATTASCLLILPLIDLYISNNFSLPQGKSSEIYMAVLGLCLCISAAQTFSFLLLSRAIPLKVSPLKDQ